MKKKIYTEKCYECNDMVECLDKSTKKPSKRIDEIAKEIHNKGIDPGFTGYMPDISDYIIAITQYLDETYEK